MKIAFTPDTQVHAGVNTDHLEAWANYIVAKQPDRIIHIGDHWDMPSLSVYEKKSSAYFHDKNYRKDIEAGNEAMERFLEPIKEEIRRTKRHVEPWQPSFDFFMGNHEYRINRAVHSDPVLEGTVTTDDLYLDDWNVHAFREIVEIEGILFSHFFSNPNSLVGGVLSGMMETRLKNIGRSFAMGHQQKRQYGEIYTASGKGNIGLVAGAFYSHDEDYMGPQSNRHHWRGAVMMHEVNDGYYDPMFLSLDYLVREWL